MLGGDPGLRYTARMTTQQHVNPAIGDPAEFLRRHDSFKKSCDFFDAHYEELLAQFPERWVGIHDGEIRADSDDLHDLLAQLDALRVPRDCSLIECLETNPLPKVL